MAYTTDLDQAKIACCHLTTYLRCVKVSGCVEVMETKHGYCVTVTPATISPTLLELMPTQIDGVAVKVLV